MHTYLSKTYSYMCRFYNESGLVSIHATITSGNLPPTTDLVKHVVRSVSQDWKEQVVLQVLIFIVANKLIHLTTHTEKTNHSYQYLKKMFKNMLISVST